MLTESNEFTRRHLFTETTAAACAQDALRVVNLAYPVFAILLLVEAGSHFIPGPSSQLYTPMVFAALLSLAWWYFHANPPRPGAAGYLLLLPWATTIIILSMHVWLDALGLSMIFAALCVLGTGVLIMPLLPMVFAISISFLLLSWLAFETATSTWLDAAAMPLLTLSIGLTAYFARRYAIAHAEFSRNQALRLAETKHRLEAEEQRRMVATSMSAAIAHHLNNQVQTILVGADIVSDTDGAPQKITKALQTSARRIAEITSKLQTYSGNSFSPPNRFEITESLPFDLIDHLKASGVNVELVNEGGPAFVLGHLDELRVAVMACVQNASEAVEESGHIHITVVKEEQWVAIRIQDDGTGMSAEQLARSAEPFFTDNTAQKEGLGLAVAHGIARQHRGSLSISSQEGEGTIVTIKVPRSARSYEH